MQSRRLVSCVAKSNCEGLDLEECRTEIVNISRQFFDYEKADTLEFLKLSDSNTQLQNIARKSIAIIFQKPKLPSWDHSRSIFAREDFLKQFFYFTTLLDENYKDLKNITKNIRLCGYLEIPSLFDKNKKIMKLMGADADSTEEPNFDEDDDTDEPHDNQDVGDSKLAVTLLQWFTKFREYFIHWNYQRGDVMMAMTEQEISSMFLAVTLLIFQISRMTLSTWKA